MSKINRYQTLNNRVVFITGGANGIGAAMVSAFLKQKAKVAFVDLDEQSANKLIKNLSENSSDDISQRIWFEKVDVTNINALQLSIQQAHEHFGGLNVLINNVANDSRQDITDIANADWQKCMQINLDSTFFASQTASELMKKNKSGCIINFSSITALFGMQHMTGYVTAKAGIIGMTKSLAKELGEFNIRVNAILPGWVATERQLANWLTEQEEQKWMESMALKKRIMPDDVANLALFLASDDSELITGQGINIDGGRT